MSDSDTTIQDLRDLVHRFVEQRHWNQFHAPKNLSMSLAIESAELMEHFQWLSVDDSRQISRDPEQLNAVGEELADILCYSLALANELQLDVATIVRQKMQKNEQKYPADKFRGRYQ